MLWQLHQQPIKGNGPTKFYAQCDINNHYQADEFVKDTTERFPLEEGMRWVMCSEESKYFVKTAEAK